MWEVEFNARVYSLTDEQVESILRAYQEFVDAQANMLDGYHQTLMAVVQQAGVPVRTFLDAQKVAAQL